MKSRLQAHLKNLRGWKTSKRYVAFAVDDYASIRVNSRQALENLLNSGVCLKDTFDRLDSVETVQDLEALFEVLDSVRDGQGRPAVFTAYALSANPDCRQMLERRESYAYETVPATFESLTAEQAQAYAGAWSLWAEGMGRGLIRPQFHGREHFNVALLEHKLRRNAVDLQANLENRSMAGLAPESCMPDVAFTEAFGLANEEELAAHRRILAEGLDLFEQVWGFRSETFTPPAMKLHPDLFETAVQGGVRAIDKPLRFQRSLGNGRVRKEFNKSGAGRGANHITVVRNVVFEPCQNMGFEPIGRALEQIEAAFFWGRPAIISSHRVNFCGHLDEGNRKTGLAALHALLTKIVERWPEVEFIPVDRLTREMSTHSSQ